jgi:hypothetical protein
MDACKNVLNKTDVDVGDTLTMATPDKLATADLAYRTLDNNDHVNAVLVTGQRQDPDQDQKGKL